MAALWRRWRRLLLGEASRDGAFDVDTTDRDAVLAVFEEGSGFLVTDGTRACMEPSHLRYDSIIDGETQERGLTLVMDDQGVACGHDAEIAVGHLASRRLYGYGDFEWRGRVHHSLDGGPPPSNSFTCFSTFVHGDKPHNELAWCFPADDGTEVHMSYWYDDDMHMTRRRLVFDATRAVHTYTVRWRAMGMDWLIDGIVVHQTRGTAGRDIPWEPMSIRVIVRPKNKPSVHLGTSLVGVSRIRYAPAARLSTLARTSA